MHDLSATIRAPYNQRTEMLLEQNRMLCQRLKGVVLSGGVAVAVLAWVYAPFNPPAVIAGWIAAFLLITGLRLALKARFKESGKNHAAATRWAAAFDLLVVGAGLVFGSAPWLIFPADVPGKQLVLLLVVAGVVAGGVVNLAVRWQPACLLVLATLTPTILRLATLDSEFALQSAFMATVFGIAMLLTSMQLSRQHARMISDRLAQRTQADYFRAQEQRYRSLVESTRAIIWEAEPGDWSFTYVSPEVESLLGYPREAWIGDPGFWTRYMHPEDRAWAPDYCAASTARGEGHVFDYRMIAADGRTVWLRDMVSILMRDDKPYKIVGVMLDITEMKQNDQALKYVCGLQQLMVELSRKFIRSSRVDIDEALEDMLAQIGSWCGVDRAYVIQFTPDLAHYRNTHEWVAPGIEPQIDSLGLVSSTTAPNIIAELKQRRHVVLSDVQALDESWAAEKSICAMQDILSLISVPIFSNGELIGLVGCDAVREKRHWSEEERSLMQMLGDLLGEALARTRADEALRESEAMRASAEALAGMGSWEWLVEERQLVVSEQWSHVSGCPRGPLGIEQLRALFPEQDWKQLVRAFRDARESGARFAVEHRLRRPDDGRILWVKAHAETVWRNGRVVKLRGFMQDVSARHEVEQELYELAHFDTLTGLPNRLLAADRLQHALQRSERHHGRLAVFFMDLDEFKRVNDTLGHDAGDRVLVEAATRLRRVLREDDTVARISGDEFIVIMEDFDDVQAVLAVAEKVLAVLREPFAVSGRQFHMTSSIGIAVSPSDGVTVESLMRSADTAMYHAKRHGGDAFEFFTHEMNQVVERQHAVEEAMRGALERGEIALHYQPIMDLAQDRIVGAEALLRWSHPLLGRVSPDEFIGVAELSGQIHALGAFVLRESLAMARHWREYLDPGFRVAINVSPYQFRAPGFAESVIAMLDAEGVPGRALDIEITESVLLSGIENVHETLETLQAAGVGIAMDDFGTGYASLSYLRDYPFSALKIDRSFIMRMDTDARSRELVVSAVRLAQSLGMRVIAEGIETHAQLRLLRAEGCELGQGFLFSPAVEAYELERLMGQAAGCKAARGPLRGLHLVG
ncbi:EAL domain-containing protein [Thioalkalivibrio sp. XN279]|uniref:bifunctional diguanylate cyclase/phosphodiesterase n=1 Tax=Thioalkalivibrio sp. XN279 TaxID=2714953 RepID=UPI00140AA695|nr:EAL domain-containing protein [Thioalkalivibrio sp. XN279]NHA15412.1 EAL domain-containing protein [Thioalkalivibrio sp. XN279]